MVSINARKNLLFVEVARRAEHCEERAFLAAGRVAAPCAASEPGPRIGTRALRFISVPGYPSKLGGGLVDYETMIRLRYARGRVDAKTADGKALTTKRFWDGLSATYPDITTPSETRKTPRSTCMMLALKEPDVRRWDETAYYALIREQNPSVLIALRGKRRNYALSVAVALHRLGIFAVDPPLARPRFRKGRLNGMHC